MDSPRSEFPSRYSTPAPELDDHRFQPSSLPRADSNLNNRSDGPSRHGTRGSNPDGELPSLLADLSHVTEELQRAGYTSRDFEQAIDEGNAHGYAGGSLLEPGVDVTVIERRGSVSPTITRRLTIRTSNHERPRASRSSSRSSQSSSRPNSVDAFADPRRRERAGTGNSRAPSDYELHRTASNISHRRRPTFSEGAANIVQTLDNGQHPSDAEDDVCFPPPEEKTATYSIDFEALEEFAAEDSRNRAPGSRCRKYSLSSQSPARKFFSDLRPKGSALAVPKIVTPETSQSDKSASNSIVDDRSAMDEKISLNPQRTLSRGRGSLMEPNRFTFFSSEIDTSIHTAALGDLVLPGESFRDIFELPPSGGVWWVDILNATVDEIHAMCKAFKVHPLTLEDILTQETREKVELFKRYYFVCFRSFYQVDKTSEEYLEPLMVYLVVFRQGILSFSFRQNSHAQNVRKRIGKLRDTTALGSDWLCYALIDDIVDGFGPTINDIEKETDMIEDSVFTARSDDASNLLRQIGLCRKKVMTVMRLLGGKADVIKGFAKRCNEQYEMTPRSDIGLYLGDVQDHVVTMMSNLNHFEKMLSRSHSNYLAQIQVDSIATGNRANEVLSKITLVATILVPLNLICGIFGMNVPVPGRSTDGLGWFFGIVGVILAIIIASVAVFKRFRMI
ncbi:MAG: Mg(2+) transporter [Trichoglossum hirsutum]|nr:MAG: Mg(2+) transporter [Trichoglossum hirsutum]